MSMTRHSTPTRIRPNAASPSAADREAAVRLAALLERRRGSRNGLMVGAAQEAIELSPLLLNLLEDVAILVAGGADVAVLARSDELTTQQAAEFLGLSRQYVVRLLDRGTIPSIRVGSHRRVRAEDLATFQRARDGGRKAALDVLTALSQEAGGYDRPVEPAPRRRAAIMAAVKVKRT